MKRRRVARWRVGVLAVVATLLWGPLPLHILGESAEAAVPPEPQKCQPAPCTGHHDLTNPEGALNNTDLGELTLSPSVATVTYKELPGGGRSFVSADLFTATFTPHHPDLTTWDWSLSLSGSGPSSIIGNATVVSGCDVNDTTCVMRPAVWTDSIPECRDDPVLGRVCEDKPVFPWRTAGIELGFGSGAVGRDEVAYATVLNVIPVSGFPPTIVINPPGEFDVGEYQFSSSSFDPDGGPLTEVWDFGDGSPTKNGRVATHQYTKPGTYTVKLKATDDEFTSAEGTRDVTVEAPTLGLGISLPDIEGTLVSVGDEFKARVTVSADDDGVGALSSLDFDGDILGFSTGVLELVDGPVEVAAAENLELQPGAEKSYDYTLRATAPGPFILSSKVAGVDAAGTAVEDEAFLNGRIGAIPVEVIPAKTEVELEDNDDGPVPQSVPVNVKVTNPFDEEMTDVELRVLKPTVVTQTERDPLQVPFAYLVDPPSQDPPPVGPPAQVPGEPEEVVFEKMAPGETKEHTFDAQAQDDGIVELQAVVTGNVGGQTVVGAGSERVKVLADVLLYFESEPRGLDGHPNGPGWVTAGQPWAVTGEFENRSADRNVIALIQPQLRGNAEYAIPHPIDLPPPADQTCGVATIRDLEPGESVPFTAPVRTIRDGGTRATVKYVVKGFLVDDQGKRTQIADTQVRIGENSAEHVSHLQTFEPTPEATTGEIIYSFVEGSLVGYGRFVEGLVALGSMAIDALALAAQPWEWPAAYRAAGDKLAEYVTHIWENLSEAEKTEWREGVINGLVIALDKTRQEVSQLVNTAVEQKFTELTNAWYTGDSVEVARWWGEFAGENPDLILEVIASGYGLCKLAARNAKYVRSTLLRKASSQADTLETRAAAGARLLENGDKLAFVNHVQKIFGIDKRSHQLLQELARKWNIMVVVRRRGFGAIEKLESGRFTPKPMSVKAKNVSPVDQDFLGMRMPDGAALTDEVAIGPPPPLDDVLAKLNAEGANRERIAEVTERWHQRNKEWPKEQAKWLKYEESGIPYPKKAVGVDFRDNVEWGWFVDESEVFTNRPFRIERTKTPGGQDLWRPQIKTSEPDGWQYVTGDIDPMAFLKPDGTPLDEATRLELYKVLPEYGFQHPESMTWTNASGRAEYFDEFGTHKPNTEAMAAYMPDGSVRATRFDPHKSWLNPANARAVNGSVLMMRGATTVIVSDEEKIVDIPIPPEKGPYITPKTIFVVPKDCPGAGGTSFQASTFEAAAASCSIDFMRDPDALVLRFLEDGTIERWTADGGWQVADVLASGVLPQTVLTTDTAVGDDTLEVRTLEELGGVAGVDEWFKVRDVLVIDPDGPNEEFVTIAGFGSIVVKGSLRKKHEAGELISVFKLAPDPPGDGSPPPGTGPGPGPSPDPDSPVGGGPSGSPLGPSTSSGGGRPSVLGQPVDRDSGGGTTRPTLPSTNGHGTDPAGDDEFAAPGRDGRGSDPGGLSWVLGVIAAALAALAGGFGAFVLRRGSRRRLDAP